MVVCDVANWNGNLYYNSGIYVDTLQTIHGCDSIVTMDLTVNYSIATNDSLVVCDVANWNGNDSLVVCDTNHTWLCYLEWQLV